MSQKRTNNNSAKHPQTKNYYYGSTGNRNSSRQVMRNANSNTIRSSNRNGNRTGSQTGNYNGNYNGNQNGNRHALAIVYPVFAYFAVCQVVGILIGMLPFADRIDAVKRQGIGSLAAFIVLYLYFVRGGLVEGVDEKKLFTASLSGKKVAGMAVAACMLGCAGIGLNNLLAMTDLKQLSQSYQTVEEAFYSSALGWELLALGVITPVAEELLYRYIIFYRLRSWRGAAAAIVGSALIFGLMHLNIVQTLYASVLGLLLGLLMEYYQDIRVAIIGHIVANILSLLRGETDFLAWMQIGHAWFLPATVLLLTVVVVIAGLLARTFKND